MVKNDILLALLFYLNLNINDLGNVFDYLKNLIQNKVILKKCLLINLNINFIIVWLYIINKKSDK